ncbi:MAG TPA: hypothetical protein VMW50_10070 [Dehalococcoidia bacterium]|nr:hypothetical protein [Dehalococcoidia bacterium]
MKKIVVLSSEQDYWEACYVNGRSVEQAHHLGDGYGKVKFLQDVCREHGLTFDDIQEISAEEVDDDKAMNCGAFPDLLSELEGDYS